MLVGLALSAGATLGAHAQLAHERRGMWAGLGVGVGSINAECSICAERAAGPTAHVRIGGTLSQRLLVGVQGTGWFNNRSTRDRSLLMLSALATFYLGPDRGLFLTAGVGGYRYVEADSAEKLTTQGFGLQLGAGIDLRIARGVSLSPFASFVVSGSGNPTRLDKSSGVELPLLSEITVQYIQLGVAATLH